MQLFAAKNAITRKRSFCDKNIHNFHCCLKRESYNSVYSAGDAQLAFTRFQGVIDRLLVKKFKMLTFAMNYKNRHPWMTEALRKPIKKKNAMYADTLQNNDEELHEKYKN